MAPIPAASGRELEFVIFGWWIRLTTNRTVRLIGLRQNRDLAYLNERFEAGELMPVIDGPYKLSDAREAFRHFGAGNHKGKVVITMEDTEAINHERMAHRSTSCG